MDNKKNNAILKGYTDTVFMIEPVAFDYNPETAVNNLFQQVSTSETKETQQLALHEFKNMVHLLRNAGIKVITIKDTLSPHTPDSIFPNNWVSFHPNNHVILYPMFAENRRLERRMEILHEIETELNRKFHYTDYTQYEKENIILEGTGSYVPDRENKIAYACLSPRTHKDLFQKFCKDNGYQAVIYNATQKINDTLHPIYHTNVVMCVTNKYVIICLDVVRDEEERKMLIRTIEKSGKEVFEITEYQMNQFSGNMLQLKNKNNEPFLALSSSAHQSLTKEQIEKLENSFELLICEIPTIEKYGGGSARCMIAEIF